MRGTAFVEQLGKFLDFRFVRIVFDGNLRRLIGERLHIGRALFVAQRVQAPGIFQRLSIEHVETRALDFRGLRRFGR